MLGIGELRDREEKAKMQQPIQADLKARRGFALTRQTRAARLTARMVSGQVAERLKAHAWKACIRQKRIAGSNPALSVHAPSQVGGPLFRRRRAPSRRELRRRTPGTSFPPRCPP